MYHIVGRTNPRTGVSPFSGKEMQKRTPLGVWTERSMAAGVGRWWKPRRRVVALWFSEKALGRVAVGRTRSKLQ